MPADHFVSQGVKYPLITNPSPPDGKKYPAIMLVHGNAGLTDPYGDQIRNFARDLSRNGYFTAVPRYYQDDHAHLLDTTPKVQIISDALSDIKLRPGVDPTRIGLIGFSLGAATCMTFISASRAQSIAVFADFFGFLTQPIRDEVARFPPTIIFHNKDDQIVPVKNSEYLDALLTTAGIVHEFVPPYTEDWQEVDHSFQPDGKADTDSRKRTAAWCVKHLPPVGV